MKPLYVSSEVAASVNNTILWGRLSPGETKFAASMNRRICHHYGLITVAVISSKGVHAALRPGLYCYVVRPSLHNCSHTLLESVWAHYVLRNAGTYAHANTNTQITQMHAQSQSHTPTHSKPPWSLWRHFIRGEQLQRIWRETETVRARKNCHNSMETNGFHNYGYEERANEWLSVSFECCFLSLITGFRILNVFGMLWNSQAPEYN